MTVGAALIGNILGLAPIASQAIGLIVGLVEKIHPPKDGAAKKSNVMTILQNLWGILSNTGKVPKDAQFPLADASSWLEGLIAFLNDKKILTGSSVDIGKVILATGQYIQSQIHGTSPTVAGTSPSAPTTAPTVQAAVPPNNILLEIKIPASMISSIKGN